VKSEPVPVLVLSLLELLFEDIVEIFNRVGSKDSSSVVDDVWNERMQKPVEPFFIARERQQITTNKRS